MFAEQNSKGRKAFAEREVVAEQNSKGQEAFAEREMVAEREVIAGRGQAPPLHYVYEHSISL